MLKKKLGIEAIESDWPNEGEEVDNFFKISPKLTIPEGCEKIGFGAFCDCWELKKIEIPEGVESIGSSAFWNCCKLKKVVIPKSVESIGEEAFCRCSNATIILRKPEKDFKYIGLDAFYRVKDVKEEIRY